MLGREEKVPEVLEKKKRRPCIYLKIGRDFSSGSASVSSTKPEPLGFWESELCHKNEPSVFVDDTPFLHGCLEGRLEVEHQSDPTCSSNLCLKKGIEVLGAFILDKLLD